LFTQIHADWLKASRTSTNEVLFRSAFQDLISNGIAQKNETLTPLLPGKTLTDAKWTTFERKKLQYLHATLLAGLTFPGMLQAAYQPNYVDHRLSIPRAWRDVYRYDSKGESIGWLRYGSEGVQTFNHEGLLVVEKDHLGRCVKGRVVRYVQEPSKQKGLNTNPLRMAPGDTVVLYEFDSPTDTRGRRAGTEPIK
jgi:hypothetical protein